MTAPHAPGPPLLEVRDLKVHFPVRRSIGSRAAAHVHAVDGHASTGRDGVGAASRTGAKPVASRKAPCPRCLASTWHFVPTP
jgi:hypothetical protein